MKPAVPDESLTVGELVERVHGALLAAGIDDPSSEARDLVAAAAGEGRFWPRLNAAAPAAGWLTDRVLRARAMRAAGAPFAYAIGRAAFRHLTLEVNERVLIPRQETELLVDLVLDAFDGRPGCTIADVGTGSGALALALASEGAFEQVIATDIAGDALAVARRNARMMPRLQADRIEFRQGDLLGPLQGERLDAIVSNPPYIAFDEARELPPSVRDWEPTLALLSGEQGLAHTARIVSGAPVLLSSGGLLALEVDVRRALLVAEMVAARAEYTDVVVHRDLTGRDRFVLARRR